MFQVRNQLKIALIYFIIAGAMGGMLRLFSVLPISVNYRYIIHGHSHVALLGWVYLAFISLLSYFYLNDDVITTKYKWFLGITHLSILGMMVSFPFQGYALFSIFFSTLFLFTSYWFTAHFIENVPKEKQTFSFQCMKVGLIFFVLSSIGPWSLGAIMTTLGATSVWYKTAIYFYLHFLYNGAFMLFIIGLFIRALENKSIEFSIHKQRKWLSLFIVGVLLSFLLSILYFDVPKWVNGIAISGALLQFLSVLTISSFIFKNRREVNEDQPNLMNKILLLLLSFILFKYALQLLSGIPFIVDYIIQSHDFIIGYLHFVFLGVISIALLFFIYHFKLLKLPLIAFRFFIFGVITSEILIVIRAYVVSDGIIIIPYNVILWAVSILMPISLMIGLIGLKRFKNENK